MKTTFKYDHYFKYDEIKSNLDYFTKTYPDLCSVESICTTEKGRSVFAVTLSDGEPKNKPAYYIDGNTHAGEVTGSMAAMHTIDYLLTNYGTDPQVTTILKRFTVYVIPRISPDGAEVYLSTPYSLRSVDRPYLTSEQDKGVYAEDIDNNGIIGMMRFKAPDGVWVLDDKNPIQMKKRTPDMMDGEFYHVYTEGMIQGDVDPLFPAKPFWGLDFNRNYPFGWFTENRQPGAGPYPLSNAENKAVVDFVIAHPNICGVATHHTSGGIILYPPGTRPEKSAPRKDMKFFKEIGAMATEEMGYGCINIFDSFFEDQSEYSSGAFDDWCYQSRGIPAYTIELWDLETRAGCKPRWPVDPTPKTMEQKVEDLGKVYSWVQEHYPEAILPWTPFKHPQLGDIEIGGMNIKFTYQNCPFDYLTQEVEKTTRFTLRMACTLPRLEISKSIQNIGEDLYKLDVTVRNLGYLPTYLTDSLLDLKLDHAIHVELDGDIEFISGTKDTEIEKLEGFGCIPSSLGFYANITTEAYEPLKQTVSYIIKAKAGTDVTLTVSAPKTGTQQEKMTL